jgi:hypothetical protein
MLAGFTVRCVGVAELAILLQLNSVRVVFLVFLGDVVALLAISTSQGNIYTHL